MKRDYFKCVIKDCNLYDEKENNYCQCRNDINGCDKLFDLLYNFYISDNIRLKIDNLIKEDL